MVRVVGVRAFILVLDEKPVVALSAEAVVLHLDEHPTAFQLLASEHEFQLAVAELLLGALVADRCPEPTIPKHHRTATVLSLRNRAFEVAVVERMVLHLHGQTLIVRINRWTPRDRPRFEHAIEFKPEIVVQACCRMFLDDEAQLLRRPDRRRSAGLGCFREVALGAIFRQFLLGHAMRSAR